MAGEVNVVSPPVATIGALALRPMRKPFSMAGIFTITVRVYQNRLICERKYMTAPNPMLANRILAARAPCWPALWISEAATDSGKGSSGSSTITRRSRVTNRMPRVPPTAIKATDGQ